MTLDTPCTSLKGVGSARAKQLQTLGIETLYDLIACFPRAYEDRTAIVTIREMEPDRPVCFEAMVIKGPRTDRIRQGLTLTRLTVADETGNLNLVYFNQPYAADQLSYGETYIFYGTPTSDYKGLQMQNPVFEKPEQLPVTTRRIMPIYGLTAGLSNKVLYKCIQQALEACLPQLQDFLPRSLLRSHNLMDIRQAYAAIHEPPTMALLEQAQRRIVFEEFFLFSAGLQLMRQRQKRHSVTPYPNLQPERFLSAFPFSPTGAQKRAVEEIRADLSSGTPMVRLLQGDVGSGKTLVAAAAAWMTAVQGAQVAFMAPTEILAEQHYRSLSGMLDQFGLTSALLTGSLSAGEKRRVKESLADGTVSVVIGTHALLTEDVSFQRLELVIADEQHRFGVEQRAALSQKGQSPHLLVMSATPIPRTLALMIYGDLDVSVLDEMPPGRQKVDTFLVGENMRQRINAFIRKHAEHGNQVYIVCPAVEESETESLKSAELWADTLQRLVFPDLRVGLLHGRLKGSEKERIMSDFSAHRLDILVSTTVIEVGVDVPNATLMIIENADRFGLSQLHQLRGRVGRGQDKSFCVLFTSNKNPDSLARLKALCSTNDGFRIAEEDLRLRGPGDFFGNRQHGLPQFKAAGLSLDLSLLKEAQEAAETALSDPDFVNDPAFPVLRQRLHTLFQAHGSTFN